jgi:hypothetical protein
MRLHHPLIGMSDHYTQATDNLCVAAVNSLTIHTRIRTQDRSGPESVEKEEQEVT